MQTNILRLYNEMYMYIVHACFNAGSGGDNKCNHEKSLAKYIIETKDFTKTDERLKP